jgi:hypothetical protein
MKTRTERPPLLQIITTPLDSQQNSPQLDSGNWNLEGLDSAKHYLTPIYSNFEVSVLQSAQPDEN